MLFRYLRALGSSRTRHEVVSMMPPGPVADRIADLGVPVHSLYVDTSWKLPAGVVRMRNLVDRLDPWVVQGWMYHGSLVATLALRLARRSDIGLVWAIHHSLSEPKLEKRATRTVLRTLRRLSDRADIITYCARQSRDQHVAFGLPADRDQVVPNAIDLDEFAPDPLARLRLQAAAGIPAGRQIVGTIARAHPMKDHPAFVAALIDLLRAGHDVHGVLIGHGQPDGPAARAARAAGIADRLTALPACDNVAALVPGLDAYLLSSAWGEALPLAVAEAMAASVPAVVTDVGDSGWLVQGCGASCPPRRPDLMAQALGRILALPADDHATLGRKARARIRAIMSMPRYIDAHADIHAAAALRRSPVPPAGEFA